jgi:hypothetical protein
MSSSYVTSLALAAAGSGPGSDRAPGEIALLGVGCAAFIALAAVMIRRARARGWRPGRVRLDAVRTDRAQEAEPDAVEDGDDAAGSVRWRLQTGVLVPAAAVILLASGMGMAVVMAGSRHGPAGRSTAAAGAAPGPAQPQTASASAGASPRPGKNPGNGAHAAASPGADPSPSHDGAAASGAGSSAAAGSAGTAPGPSAPSGPGPAAPVAAPPSPGTLAGLPSSFVPCTASSDSTSTYTCSFTFTAEGGPVSYTVSAPDDPLSDFGITIMNASGTLAAGQPATVTVSVTVEGLGNAPTEPNVTVNPGGTTVGLDVPPDCAGCS